MRFQRKLEIIVLTVVLTMVGAVHAQVFKPTGEMYDTAPITGDVFRCYVSNVSNFVNAVVVNVRIYDGKGNIINKGGSTLTAKDCKKNGGVTLLPHETCGIEGYDQASGSSAPPKRTAAHCQFTVLGIIRGSLESHLEKGVKDTSARLRADAKRTNTD